MRLRAGIWKRRGRRTVVAVALTACVVAGTTGLAAGGEQRAVTGPVPGTGAWRADRGLGPLPDPATASPGRVAAFFARLGPQQRRALVHRHPLVVGNLDGVPVPLRYEANALALTEERDRQRSRAQDPALTEPEREAARARADRCAGLLGGGTGGRQILAFDPRGRGQVADVHGDLTRADHVAVVVPGSDIDLDTFDRAGGRYGTPTGMARSLYAATGGRTAVVAWAGYTTPVGLGPDAATGRLAEAGAPRLVRFVRGLVAAGAPRPAVFCHSYGSVVCGLAARDLPAADIVVAGSPGMRAEDVGDLRTSARVWAARSADDWIGRVPHVQVFGLGHGADPAAAAFGARLVPAERAGGHSGYFAPGTDSLRVFARIALGVAA
ncbi:alpha/beta hydrolase [Streptomyces sp. NPDC002734]|uniref:alpha/beta hydrolase n=1 Tax=Streptomyces sp. NPDC002734 TaxID=3154426 RepID=UPI003317C28E